jgi:hypothetical protein
MELFPQSAGLGAVQEAAAAPDAARYWTGPPYFPLSSSPVRLFRLLASCESDRGQMSILGTFSICSVYLNRDRVWQNDFVLGLRSTSS